MPAWSTAWQPWVKEVPSLFHAAEKKIYSPGYHVHLVDPCGSGDGFTAGFIHALLEGESLKHACRLGNALGAMVAQQEGATQPISYREVMAFMDTNCPEIIDKGFTDFMK